MRRIILSVLLLVPLVTHALEPGKFEPLPLFTWGARVGFNATGTYIDKAVFDGKELGGYEQDTQVGNFIALQFRLNSSRLFFQSGVGLSSNKSTVSIDRNSWNSKSQTPDYLSVSCNMKSLTVPVQVGYHIVNQSPYSMSVFTGPRFNLGLGGNMFSAGKTYPGLMPVDAQWGFGLAVTIQEAVVIRAGYDTGLTNALKDNKDLSYEDVIAHRDTYHVGVSFVF